MGFLRPNAYATPEVHDDRAGDYLNRPFYRTEHLVAGELRLAHWLEVNNKPYSMLTDWDVTMINDVLDPAAFKTVIISTHSEYWSPQMYNAVKTYLDKGGNVISLSGNTCYWDVTLTGGAHPTLEKNLNHNLVLPLSPPAGSLPELKPANWTWHEQMSLLGIASFFDSGTGEADATGYQLDFRKHWAFASVPALTSIGTNGVIMNRSFAKTGRGASGWEVDTTTDVYGRIHPHVFAREYNDIAQSTNAFQHSHIVHMRRASAGQVFSVASILAGQSLMVDTAFSNVMKTVLARFATLSFSDYTSDGKSDLIGLTPNGTLWVYAGTGAGNVDAGVPITPNWTGYNRLLAPGDMDSNGKPDLITRGNDGKLWLHKRSSATGELLRRVQIGTGWNAYDIILAPGDVDHDGRPDLLARSMPDGTLWLFRGTGLGTISPRVSFDAGWAGYNAIYTPGDVNEDGHPDLLARDSDGKLYLFKGNGNAGLQAGGTLVGTGFDAYTDVICPGDFDKDGHCDIIGRTGTGDLYLYGASWSGGAVEDHVFNDGFTAPVFIDGGWDAFNDVVGVW